MSTKTPPFSEKEFLLGLLSTIESSHGKELRFIMEHRFDSIDLSILPRMPTLNDLSSDICIKKFLMQWFKEAEARKLVSFVKPQYYKFTELGYICALSKKNPVKQFIKNNPKYAITTAVAFSAALFTAIRLIKC